MASNSNFHRCNGNAWYLNKDYLILMLLAIVLESVKTLFLMLDFFVLVGGGSGIQGQCRKPEIMGDAAYAILSRESTKATGYFYIDEAVLKEEGITDMTPYDCVKGLYL